MLVMWAHFQGKCENKYPLKKLLKIYYNLCTQLNVCRKHQIRKSSKIIVLPEKNHGNRDLSFSTLL